MHYLLFYIQLHLTSDICVTEEKVPSGKGFNGMVRDYFFCQTFRKNSSFEDFSRLINTMNSFFDESRIHFSG